MSQMLREEAYEKFKERILSGELKPGQMVSQRELAEMVDIPLGPAREAIQRLAFESLLRVHPNRGIQVSEISYRTIRSSYQLRTLLEVEAIRRFCKIAKDEDILSLIDKVKAILARPEKSDDPNFMVDAVAVDWDMHETFINCLDNEVISETYQINHSRIILFRANNRFSNIRVRPALSEHIDILNCCLKRDEEECVSLLKLHINASKDAALSEI